MATLYSKMMMIGFFLGVIVLTLIQQGDALRTPFCPRYGCPVGGGSGVVQKVRVPSQDIVATTKATTTINSVTTTKATETTKTTAILSTQSSKVSPSAPTTITSTSPLPYTKTSTLITTLSTKSPGAASTKPSTSTKTTIKATTLKPTTATTKPTSTSEATVPNPTTATSKATTTTKITAVLTTQSSTVSPSAPIKSIYPLQTTNTSTLVSTLSTKSQGEVSTKPRTLSECPAVIDEYNVKWERGLPGQYMQHNCPSGFSGSVIRMCGTDGVYHSTFYNCTSAKLRILAQKAGYKNFSVSHILDELSSATTTNATYQPLLAGDMETVTAIMTTVTERVKTDGRVNTDQINNYLEIANSVMEERNKNTWKSLVEKTGLGVDRVLNNIDNFIQVDMTMNRSTDSEESFSKSNLYLSIGRIKNFQYNVTFPNRRSGNIPLWAKDTADIIVISFENDEEDRAYSVAMYRDLREMIPDRMAPDQQSSKELLNSRVMAMTLFPKKEFHEDQVTITFNIFKRDVNNEPKCSYWNTGQDIGYWSTDGCVLVSYKADRGIAVCECNHLTNFAILMSQTIATAEHTKKLSIFSLVGCIISMMFLVATVAVHLKYWRHVEREQTTVLLNLCISLFLGYTVFLAGINKVMNKAVCTFVAVLLHFIYIVVFFTMLAHGVLLAKAVIKPFNKTPIAKWSLLASYGGASIIVGISKAVTQLDGYGSSSSCWLSVGSRLIWTFIAPVLVVCVINTVIIGIVLWKMYGTAVMSRKSIRDKAAIGLRNISILLPILGATWAFGVFSVNEDTVVFQYLFCIFNTLKGLIIFIFHCIMNEKIKKAFLRSFKMDQSPDTTSSDKDKTTHRTTNGHII